MSAGADAVGGAPGARWAAALDRHGAAAPQVGPRALAWGSVAAHWPGRAVRQGRDDPAHGLRACDHARRARYAGVLVRDGWAPYRKLPHATHQTCLARLLRRTHLLLGRRSAGRRAPPHAVRRLLLRTLALRE